MTCCSAHSFSTPTPACMRLQLSIVLAASSLYAGIRADSGFAANCSKFSLCGTVLRATCLDDDSRPRNASIDLNKCLGYWPDHNGYIWCQQDAGLGGCDQCALNGSTVLCPCPGDDETWKHFNPFDLDTCIGITNGQLTCSDPVF